MAGATPVGGICIHGERKQIFVLFYGCWGQNPRTHKLHTSTPLESYIPSPVSKLTVNSLGSMGHPGHLSNYSTLLLQCVTVLAAKTKWLRFGLQAKVYRDPWFTEVKKMR